MRDGLASKRKDITWTEKSVHGENNPNYGGGSILMTRGM